MTEEVVTEPVIETAPPPPPVEIPPPEIVEPPPPVSDKKPIPTHVPRSVVEQVRESRRAVQAELDQTRRELAEARALAERLSKTKQGDEPPEPRPPRPPIRSDLPPPDDVERRAQELVMNREIGRVNDAGVREYGRDWQELVNVLTDFDLNNPAFLSSVMDVDSSKAHEILYRITRDGDQLSNLARMTPARRIAEITRMTMAPERGADGKFVSSEEVVKAPPVKEAPKQVSKAPAPPPPVVESAKEAKDWRSPEATEDEFQRGWEEMMDKRTKSGRKYGG